MATNCGCEGCDFCDLKILSPKKTLLITKGENCIFKVDLNTELVNNFNILDSQGINLTGNGTFGTPLTAAIILDPNPVNILQITAGGLLVNGTGFLYTDEQAQDAVGTILNSSEFVYSDTTPLISINQISWLKITSTPIIISSLAAIGNVPNANGMTLTGSVLNLQPASATFGGVLKITGTQVIAGNKSFTNTVTFTDLAGGGSVTHLGPVEFSNLSGRINVFPDDPDANYFSYEKSGGGEFVLIGRFDSAYTTTPYYANKTVISSNQPKIDFSDYNDGITPIEYGYFLKSDHSFYVTQNLHIGSITHETTDIDTFLVSNAGLIKYRTGSEFFSDIITQGAALTTSLTTLTQAGAFTPDYAIQALGAGGFGFATLDEGETVLSVILNMQVRINQLEARLQAHGLIA